MTRHFRTTIWLIHYNSGVVFIDFWQLLGFYIFNSNDFNFGTLAVYQDVSNFFFAVKDGIKRSEVSLRHGYMMWCDGKKRGLWIKLILLGTWALNEIIETIKMFKLNETMYKFLEELIFDVCFRSFLFLLFWFLKQLWW